MGGGFCAGKGVSFQQSVTHKHCGVVLEKWFTRLNHKLCPFQVARYARESMTNADDAHAMPNRWRLRLQCDVMVILNVIVSLIEILIGMMLVLRMIVMKMTHFTTDTCLWPQTEPIVPWNAVFPPALIIQAAVHRRHSTLTNPNQSTTLQFNFKFHTTFNHTP